MIAPPSIVSVSPNGIAPQGEDTGVHAVLIEGQGLVGITGNEVCAACILRGGEMRLAIQLSTGLYGEGIPFDWNGERTFKLRRLVNGDGQIEFGGQIETVPHDRLASSSRADASFAFGCFLDAAAATATFGPIGQPISFPAFLHGSGSNANPPVLFLDHDAPAGSTAKYKDSAGIKFGGGNPWRLHMDD